MTDLRPSSTFGELVFNRKAMRERLPKDVFAQLMAAVDTGEKIDAGVADIVASAMKEWALSKGATHYTHWFHPRTEKTAEKHMAFLSLDMEGTPLESFTGSELIQSEPDASSLPSGGMRSTFEARGYTAWDPSSPAFVVQTEKGGTLCIPSIFISYDGTPLDLKTPLLKSLNAIESRALRLLRLFGNRGVRWVKATIGAEQEFFLVNESKARLRPDIIFCGHTLCGAQPPKGQQMEDHYFGTIHPKVLAYMEDVQRELARLGIAIKTRHNEVAPCQFEFAPEFSEANLANDQNQLMMAVMKRFARRHDLRLLLHEKPFSGLNGSGKHTNFSLMDSEGRNLLSPSGPQKRSIQFLTFLGAFLLGLSRYGSLLRASIASPGNMYRLGGNEAPPAIMSVYLGEVLNRILDRIEEGLPESIPAKGSIDLGLNRLPEIKADNTDRNRTAPIAFTGNKFEFRGTGASQSLGGPVTMLMAAWAWGLEQMTGLIENRLGDGVEVSEAALEAIRFAAIESRNVRFDGNCYSDEWAREAVRRGLPVAYSTPEALSYYLVPENRELLSGLKIMSDREITAFYEIQVERYLKSREIELGVLESMVREGILPAVTRQLELDIKTYRGLTETLSEEMPHFREKIATLARIREKLVSACDRAQSLRARLTSMSLEEGAEAVTSEGLALMGEMRSLCDSAESHVGNDFWPYPRYRELLLIF
ncbi:MAG: glutamine synthetase type III [Synergistaceae bacterium]|jgi:glutamine synthetase|nr:glutamine synthetase type III [Synergistaceae bacterium]